MAATHLRPPADILFKILDDYGHNAESIFLEEGIRLNTDRLGRLSYIFIFQRT